MVRFAKEEDQQDSILPFSGRPSDICWLIFIQEQPFDLKGILVIFSDREEADCYAFNKTDLTYVIRKMTWKEVVAKYGKKYSGCMLDCPVTDQGCGIYYTLKTK